jgi:hypothetical protein
MLACQHSYIQLKMPRQMGRCYDTVTITVTGFCNTNILGKITYFGIYILPSSVKNVASL